MTTLNFLLAFLAIAAHQSSAAPISNPTTSPPADTAQTCSISIANERSVLHDTACIQDAFSEFANRLTVKHITDYLTCSSHDDSSVLEMFQLLERNVDLLDNIQMSELNNVSYSQYNCTLRQVVLPFLSKTLNETCNCPGVECAAATDEAIPQTANDVEEYCVVTAIDTLLRRLVQGTLLEHFTEELLCQVDFEAREQMESIETSVDAYSREVVAKDLFAVCQLDTSSFVTDDNHTAFACLSELTTILGNTSDETLQRLAVELQDVLPSFETVLVATSSSDSCSVDAEQLTAESDTCLARHLSTLYSSVLLHVQDQTGVTLTCSSDDTVSAQGYMPEDFQPDRPTGPPSPVPEMGQNPEQSQATPAPTSSSTSKKPTSAPSQDSKSRGYVPKDFTPSRPA